jgi:hypothetical protein
MTRHPGEETSGISTPKPHGQWPKQSTEGRPERVSVGRCALPWEPS